MGWNPVNLAIRFLLKLAALADIGAATLSWVPGILVTVHYLVAYDRIKWLLHQ